MSSALVLGLGLLLAGVFAGCVDHEEAAQPAPSPDPPTPEQIEWSIRHRLGVPDDSRVVAVFGMTAHWDINWLKTYENYYSRNVEKAIAKALALLAADSAYTYAISEIEFLRRYWEDHPEDQARIRGHVATGRLRIVGGGMTSPDTLLPPAELLIRDWSMGNRWCLENLGIKPFTAWQPDSFGHAPSLPAILDILGYRYVSFARIDGAPTYVPRHHPSPPPLPGTTAAFLEQEGVSDFFWVTDDGSRVLTHWLYDGYAVADWVDVEPPQLLVILNFLGIDPETTPFWKPDRTTALDRIAEYLDHMEPMRNTPYVFVPAGIDFAFPKERLPEYLAAWNADRYPATGVYCVFAPFEDYVQMVGGRHASLPIYSLDISPVFMGFYTTKPALKIHHRQALEALLAAEKLAVLAGFLGRSYPDQELADSWHRAVRLNHHDGIPGTSTDPVYAREQLPEIRDADQAARRLSADLLSYVAERVDTSHVKDQARTRQVAEQGDTSGAAATGGVCCAAEQADPSQVAGGLSTSAATVDAGSALVVFNPLSRTRTDWVEFTVPVTGEAVQSVRVFNAAGEEIPAQILDSRRGPDGSLEEAKIGFVARGVPSAGWTTYGLREDPDPYPVYETGLTLTQSSNTVEIGNGLYDLRIDLRQGACLTSLVEKSTGREFLSGPGNDVTVYADLGGLYRLGHEIHENGFRQTFATSGSKDFRLQILERGPVRLRLEVETSWTKPILREVVLYDGLPRIEASATVEAPLETAFTVRFPTSMTAGSMTMEIPGSEIDRPERKAFEPTFWPGIGWADLSDPTGQSGFTATALGSRGWHYSASGLLELMLHRNALIELPVLLGPPGIDRGPHTIRYALYPSSGGNWIDRQVWAPAGAVDAPLQAALTGVHAGTLASTSSVVAVDDPRVEVTTLKRWEGGGEGLCLRLLRHGPDPVTAQVTLGLPGTWTALEADAGETRIGRVLGAGTAFKLRLDKRIATVKLQP